MSPIEAAVFAQRELETLRLGDVRRDRRATQVLAGLLGASDSSIAAQNVEAAATKGSYRLLENNDVSYLAVSEAHACQTIERARQHDVVLAVQDTTGVSLGGLKQADGLGPITDAKGSRGYLVHSTLIVEPNSGEVLGVAAQQVWVRSGTKKPKKERPDQRKNRSRESEIWPKGQRDVATAFGRTEVEGGGWSPAATGDPHVIAVFDREGDIFEAFEALNELDHGFVIRAVHNRLLVGEDRKYSLDAVASERPIGQYRVDVPRKAGGKAREAELTARTLRVQVRPPKNRGRKGRPQSLTIVLVREETPPPGEPGLCWYLVTTESASTAEEVQRIIQIYRLRWLIEEFHMGLKTGVGIEQRQFESFQVHRRFLAFATIAAWQLLALRHAARTDAARPATALLSNIQLAIIRSRLPKLPKSPTVREAYRGLAMLGGFMGRKGDGEPGWRTLWRGFAYLAAAEAGYLFAKMEG